MAVTYKLEFSEDDLSVSNAACTKVDITDLVKAGSLKYSGGIDRLGDPPKDGTLEFVLEGRDFEPLNEDSPYSPNVVRRRRFFLSVLRGATYEPEFVGYARTYQPTWPGSVLHQEIEVVCGDGTDVLANALLPALDPPTAESIEEVVMHDAPFGYYRLGEKTGAVMAAAVGPEGVYKNKPTLGVDGHITGDPDTAVLFSRDGGLLDRYGRAPIADAGSQFLDTNALTVEMWVRRNFAGGGPTAEILGGPWRTASSSPTFRAQILGSNVYRFQVVCSGGSFNADSTTASDTATVHHVVGTYDGMAIRIYVNGTLEATTGTSGALLAGNANDFLYVGASPDAAGSGDATDVALDEVAFYEHALSADRVLAHYQAGSAERGFPQQTAGERIEALCDLDLWDTGEIQAGAFQVLPAMKIGQSPLEEIEEAMRAEGKRTLWGFRGDGDPLYLGWEWMAASPYNEIQATFGAPPHDGEIAYDSEAIHLDDEVYTERTQSRIGGAAITQSVEAPANEESVAEPETDLTLVDDDGVEALGSEFLTIHGEPSYTLDSLTLHSSDEDQEDLMFDLGLGDRVRFKRYTEDENGDEVLGLDLVTHIIGFDKHWGEGGTVTCTWRLARGFNAAEGVWRLGVVGFTELGETTVLG